MINALKTTRVVRIPLENVNGPSGHWHPWPGRWQGPLKPNAGPDQSWMHCPSCTGSGPNVTVALQHMRTARPMLHWHARPLQFESSQLGWRSRWHAQAAGGRLGWAANWQVRSVTPRYRDSCGMRTQTDHRPSQRLASTSTTATPRPTRTSAAGPCGVSEGRCASTESNRDRPPSGAQLAAQHC